MIATGNWPGEHLLCSVPCNIIYNGERSETIQMASHSGSLMCKNTVKPWNGVVERYLMMWETLMRHYKEIKNQVTSRQMEHDARVSYCSRCCDRIADRTMERKVWFYLSFPEGLLSVVRNSWQQERKISYCFCGQKAEEDKMQRSICFSLFIQYRTLAVEMVPPNLGRWGSPLFHWLSRDMPSQVHPEVFVQWSPKSREVTMNYFNLQTLPLNSTAKSYHSILSPKTNFISSWKIHLIYLYMPLLSLAVPTRFKSSSF